MNQSQLIMTLPHGNVTATSLGIEGLAHRRSPGSGKHFRGRSIMVELACDGEKPAFSFLDEGGWRDPFADSVEALAGVKAGSRTKTALSNAAFSSVPLSAFRSCYLVKTGGEALALGAAKELAAYTKHDCHERMTGDEIAGLIGQPAPAQRTPRLYMVIAPIQFVMLSNLTPAEYAWYATHRPGKMFRQVMFTELGHEELHMAAQSRYLDAKRELLEKTTKKTKSIVFEDCMNQIPFQHWVGYHQKAEGGLYAGDRSRLLLYPFPTAIPHSWEKVEG
ncbi:MAG: hypothetical protein FDZ69_02215 [Deltaproteobacteria bacterium]|nr:MAG: hypothetical protein FDZ69_02215 [Deltaproteobacteria bacterium]